MIVPRLGDLVLVSTNLDERDVDWKGMPSRKPNWYAASSPVRKNRYIAGLWLGVLGAEGKPLDNDARRTVFRAIEAGRDPTRHVRPLYGVLWEIGRSQRKSVVLLDDDATELVIESTSRP